MADNDKKLIAPYVEWAVATQFRYLPGCWFRVLLELDVPVAQFATDVERNSGFLKDYIRVPSIFQSVSREFARKDLKYCMAIMSREALEALVGHPDRKELRARLASATKPLVRIELGTPTTTVFEPTPAETPQEALATSPPQAPIVAVIDDGIAFAHERFRFADGTTRFKYFWDQDDIPANVLLSGNKVVPGFGFGHEMTGGQINMLLGQCTHGRFIDEDEVYRKAGQKLVGRRAAHGTHVMDIACGLDSNDANENSPYLIGVQLPKWVTEETSGVLLTPLVDAAMAYILNRADLIAAADNTGPLPVVVNLSYGTIAGPHDGTGELAAAIDELIATRGTPLNVVLPAGNHYLARCHAHLEMPQHTKSHTPHTHLTWRVQPDDKAGSFVEVYLPPKADNGQRPHLAFRVQTPTGQQSSWIHPGGHWRWPSASDVRFEAIYYDNPGERQWLRLSMAPTTQTDPNAPPVPSGNWRIDIENHGGALKFDAWVQRGDTPFGHPLWGRQSRFDDRAYKRFDLAGRPQQQDNAASPIRRRGSLNAIATGQYTTVVGGFRHSDGAIAEYSGSGPVATPRAGPDVSAVADDSVAARGVVAAGTRSGSVIALRGTSVAAPQVTRRIADLMTQQVKADRAAVRQAAQQIDPVVPGSPKEERFGVGKFDGPEPAPEQPPPLDRRWKKW